MSQIIKPVMLDETGQALVTKQDQNNQITTQRMAELIGQVQTLAEAIEAVHSVNGMTGDVVIDSSNIVLNKLTNPKTIAQVLSEEQSSVNTAMSTIQEAITRTPVNMSTSQIEDTDDYVLELTLSTP